MRKRRYITLILLLVATLLVTACTTHYRESSRARGVYHKVRKGETLYSIARTYHIDLQELAEINNITDPSLVETNDVIFIPDAQEVLDVKTPPYEKPQQVITKKPPVTKPEKPARQAPPRRPPQALTSERGRFIWPVNGTILSKFGIQPNGMRFNGIKIKGKEGAPVLASASGRVIRSSPLKYYGQTIIIKHNNNYTTVYSHLKKRMVNENQTVRKGQTIALLGKHERNGECCLHFEIRKKNKPKNPLFYLPKTRSNGTKRHAGATRKK